MDRRAGSVNGGTGIPHCALSVIALAAALVTASCAVVPRVSRADLRPPESNRSVTTGKVASQVSATGRSGRLSAAERTKLLARVASEGNGSLLNRQIAAMAAVDEVELLAQNRAGLLIDGPAAFAAMFKAIAAARSTILLQSYIVEDSAIAQQLADLLALKRTEGVQVAMLYDAVGSFGTSDDYFDRLRSAGVLVCSVNPVNPLERPGYWDIIRRDHRKILTVDRQTGFTGGINISAVYSSGSFGRGGRKSAKVDPKTGWRDTQIQLQGPAAAVLDDLVRDTWRDQGCTDPLPPPAELASAKAGDQVVRIVPTSADDSDARIYRLLLTAIDTAQRSVYLTMAYFAPGQDMVDALCDAARRGVDVQLVLPAHSDFAPVLQAGRSYYQTLLDSGVKLHELQDAVLHAKTAVIDGVVSTVGSSNMDWRSFASNNEVNAVVFGEDFGSAMTRMFEGDVRDSSAITAAQWSQRPLLQRAKEWAARVLERLW